MTKKRRREPLKTKGNRQKDRGVERKGGREMVKERKREAGGRQTVKRKKREKITQTYTSHTQNNRHINCFVFLFWVMSI